MTPELIGILAVGATVIGLMLTFRREARADNQALRAEFRADNQALRDEFRAENQRLRAEVNAGLADVRKDVQALTARVSGLEARMSRLEGIIQGLFGRPGDRDRHDDAA